VISSGGRDGPDDVVIRDATADDDAAVRALVGSVMGWGDDGAAARMWRWKHVDNASGRSPTWVAVRDDGTLLGVRTFLRWRFVSPDGPRTAVRAVDTVTHPDARGRGLFKRLTLHGLDRLAEQGVDFVFNTPNDQSRPGYLSMGWQPVRQLAVAVQPRGPVGAVRMARNRVPADLDSLPLAAGTAAADGLDDRVCAALAGPTGAITGLTTRRDPAHLRWRYAGLPELAYRVLLLGDDPAEGVAVVRARRRGTATELTVAELAAPSAPAAARLVRSALRATRADFALALPARGPLSGGGVPVPSLGPLLVAREISTRPPAPDAWQLSLGDVELF
jgi:hypothetical protein